MDSKLGYHLKNGLNNLKRNNMTAVEWFEQQLDNLNIEIPQLIFEQAKEMGKQHIIDAYDAGFNLTEVTGEIYYNKTFKK